MPKNKSLLFIVLVAALGIAFMALAGATGATEVTDDIASSTRWDSGHSPYVITKDITVLDGVTLTIDPGVEVLFDGSYSLSVAGSGKVVASGTAGAPINISSNKQFPAMGDWNGLYIGIGGTLKNATIEYGTMLVTADLGSVVSDCHFQHATQGLHVTGGGTTVVGCTFWAIGSVGLAVQDAAGVQVLDCQVDNCPQAFNLLGSTSATIIKDCWANNSAEHGFGYTSTGGANRIIDCRVTRSGRGVYITGLTSAHTGGLMVYNCVFERCTSSGVFFETSIPTQMITIQRCKAYDGGTGLHSVSSGNFEVTECTFRENNKGTIMEQTTGYTSYIHKNNFIKNNLEAETVDSEVYYDKDGMGNFWYKAIFEYGFRDTNPKDGIADTPWSLTGTQKDNYPLMKPVDFEKPIADAGPDKRGDQRKAIQLDGSGSTDDTFVWNYTWLVDLPGESDPVYYGPKPNVIIADAGLYTVTLYCKDFVNNSAYDTMTLNVTDADAPRFVNITTPEDVGAGTVLTFSAIVDDNIGVVEVWTVYRFGIAGQNTRLNLEDQGDGLWAVDLPIPLDLTQKVFYTLTAKDGENNIQRTGERAVNVRDVTPPEILPSMATNVTTGDSAWINATITDNRVVCGASVEYWYGEGEHTTVNLSRMGPLWILEIEVPRDAPSPLRMIIRSDDTAGNLNETQVLEVPVADNDKPVVNLDNTSPLIYQGEKTIFSAVISDNLGIHSAYVELKYSGDSEYTPQPMVLEDDNWIALVTIETFKVRLFYHFRVIDTSGNVLVTEDEDVLLLSQHPTIVTTPELESWEGVEYRQQFEADDPDNEPFEMEWSMETDATWLDINKVEGVIYGTPQDIHVGSYTVTIIVEDPDRSSDSITFTLVVNDVNAAPEVTIIFPEDGQKVGTVLRVSGRATDDLGEIVWVRVRIDEGEWEDASGTTVWDYEVVIKGLTPGEHYIDAKASDGLQESKHATVVIIVPKKDNGEDGGGLGDALGTIAIVVVVALAIGLLLAYLLVVRRE